MWNKNERDGKVHQAKGKVKQAVGALTGDKNLQAEGEVDETVGKVEAAVGRTSRKAGDAITRVGNAVKTLIPPSTIESPTASPISNANPSRPIVSSSSRTRTSPLIVSRDRLALEAPLVSLEGG
jgi:uncharacterized protein YjbJ (UPF0337 family)